MPPSRPAYRIQLDRPLRNVRTVSPNRRFLFLLFGAFLILSILFLANLRDPEHVSIRHQPMSPAKPAEAVIVGGDKVEGSGKVDLTGHAIAPKLGNETIKAELGRASWRLFHTTFARFPDTPTPDESEALRTYIHLFQRLYPCGECAEHFGSILKKFPPQVSSRKAAAGWGCHVHNEVNKSLKKELFNCNEIGDFYDCGCAEDGEGEGKKE